MTMQIQERLLHRVLGLVPVSEHARQQAEHLALMAPDQLTEGAQIPAAPAIHQRKIRVGGAAVVEPGGAQGASTIKHGLRHECHADSTPRLPSGSRTIVPDFRLRQS